MNILDFIGLQRIIGGRPDIGPPGRYHQPSAFEKKVMAFSIKPFRFSSYSTSTHTGNVFNRAEFIGAAGSISSIPKLTRLPEVQQQL
jgi:hypothetical protein